MELNPENSSVSECRVLGCTVQLSVKEALPTSEGKRNGVGGWGELDDTRRKVIVRHRGSSCEIGVVLQ